MLTKVLAVLTLDAAVLVRVSVRVRVSWSSSLAGCGAGKEVGKRDFTSEARRTSGPGLDLRNLKRENLDWVEARLSCPRNRLISISFACLRWMDIEVTHGHECKKLWDEDEEGWFL